MYYANIKELLGGLKDLEGRGLHVKSILEEQLPSEDVEVSSLCTDLKDLLSKIVVLMAQTEKLNRATKVNENAGGDVSSTAPTPPTSRLFPTPKSPPHLAEDENGRRSPEGSATITTPSSKFDKSSTDELTHEYKKHVGQCQEQQQRYERMMTDQQTNNRGAYQCGCCGAPILVSVMSLPDVHMMSSNNSSHLLRENFYRIPTTPHQPHQLQQNNVFH